MNMREAVPDRDRNLVVEVQRFGYKIFSPPVSESPQLYGARVVAETTGEFTMATGPDGSSLFEFVSYDDDGRRLVLCYKG